MKKFIGEYLDFSSSVINSKQLIQSLTDSQIIEIMNRLGATIYDDSDKEFMIFPTICHNHCESSASMKLYYYKDSKKFYCYTECSQSFDIIGLIAYKKKIHYIEAIDFISQIVNYQFEQPDIEIYESVDGKYQKKITSKNLRPWNEIALNCFYTQYPSIWLKEGITKEAMNKFGIKFSIYRNSIIIPHRDVNGYLIGIRGRNLNHELDSKIPKYCPISINEITYSYPSSYNLYGIFENHEIIQKAHNVIIFEGEKSVIKSSSWSLGENSVAVCGSQVHKPQIDLLLRTFPKLLEITIAFDKEYENYGDKQYNIYFQKLYSMCEKYNHYCRMSFIIDKNNLLKKKDSPADRGEEVFYELYKNRIIIEG